MQIINYLILALLIAVIVLLLKKKKDPKTDDQSFVMIQNQLNEVTKTLDSKLSDTNKMVDTKMSESLGVIKDVTESLTKLDKTNQQVMGVTDKLQNLEKVLLSQKKRGNLGEAGLKLVLENILPPTAYKLQYEIDKERRVDAVIMTKDGVIPVDAKFSLENYKRVLDEEDETVKAKLEIEFKNDLKKTIEQTSKYIDPKLGTLDFAFMFIPSEAIYYDLLVNEVGAVKVNTRSLIEYAFKEKKVIIVSPTTFAAYLQTVLQGLNALKIEKQTKEIIKRVGMLQRHLVAYDDYFKKIGSHLGTTVNTYNSAYKEFKKVDKDVVKITGQDTKIEPELIDKPQVEE
jgi:DNA recombination protein RmuC